MRNSNGQKPFLTDGNLRFELEGEEGCHISLQAPGFDSRSFEILMDAGCNGCTTVGLLEYDCLDNKRTWELPLIRPRKNYSASWQYRGFHAAENSITTFFTTEEMEFHLTYRIITGCVCVSAELRNCSDKRQILNGVAFILKDTSVCAAMNFEFPGNVPLWEFNVGQLPDYMVIETGLVNPVIHQYTKNQHFNTLFLDSEEKWGTGVYKENEHTLVQVNFAAVECSLDPGESIRCGDLYLQPVSGGNPYLPVRELYRSLGYTQTKEGISDGILYSCHPAGTMDANFPYISGRMGKDFPYNGSMRAYASELDRLRDMGIDHVWILPIFDHKDRGVYHPTDQSVIDARYGGDEAVRFFCDRAHELGMTVLFDYVPHGPAPEDALAREHMEWCSVDRENKPVIEWNCVSFDMCNPDYLQYHKNLVKDHIARFGIDGSRIDCAMGGLSNWRPYGCNRPSNSNLKGGVAISSAIRQAFIECGKKPVVTPENFNPLPMYYHCTDIFYDMPLYRVFCELEDARLSPEDFTYQLTRWLNAELQTTPAGYSKLRFLGNHDTVTWVFQKARATKVYGIDKAKALFALISFIDGMPMLYQGDEDPKLYMGEGPELRGFFRELFAARKNYLGNRFDMEYEFTGTAVMAFNRRYGTTVRKVLINFSPSAAEYRITALPKKVLFGECQSEDGRILLEGCKFAILEF